ncbi:MAG: hypothetical protein A2Z86_12275 [Candidatus Glassbacteria bacterium GWA2_58_10]|uniref:DNA mismatch repair protein MutL n=1 Tax=Candidatus Glassbacteria bacterium GWA2_58_10 TaxID=1817865 RepID=A0A1F5YCX5_9BACT|nr:MAG: hypothetical protein A2Z86_12275 [Candidatus Glassbacteria bacterium GWA2_58_10]
MARTIHLLDENTRNLIAAGEVIERPASVVKELVENSLDSGARRITVECEGAGNRLIRVIDDGAGMEPEDAELAFSRHATSKISSAGDLANIATLGFRGEALPSIAAVSRFELETCSAANSCGTLLVVEGGRTVEKTGVSRAPGTTATVRNLFYNVPARRKFLKSDQTELRHIVRVVTSLAIAQVETVFKLIHEGRELLSVAPGGSLTDRVEELFGRKRTEKYLPVLFERGDTVIGGLIAAPDSVSGVRPEQHMFINRRPFSSRAVIHAVHSGYRSTIPDSAQPAFFLFLTLRPAEVDVNVHPAKLEVRFRDEGLVYSMVHRAVQEGLRSGEATPEFSEREGGKLFSAGAAGYAKGLRGRLSDSRALAGVTAASGYQTSFLMPLSSRRSSAAQEKNIFPAELSPRAKSASRTTPGPALSPDTQGETLPSIWQLHGRYIFVETKSGCLVIDQHAAHERVLYEKIIRDMSTRSLSSQRLLFPVTLQLTPEEHLTAEQFLAILEQAGFELDLFSGRTIVVRSAPALKSLGSVEEYFRELLHELSREGQGSAGTRHQALARSLACRGAIKSGKELAQREMNELIDQLFATELPYADVHGRNTIVELSLDEIDKRFGRT